MVFIIILQAVQENTVWDCEALSTALNMEINFQPSFPLHTMRTSLNTLMVQKEERGG